MAFVEFRDVRKVYRMGEVEVAAVDGMTFDIERGELVFQYPPIVQRIYVRVLFMKIAVDIAA